MNLFKMRSIDDNTIDQEIKEIENKLGFEFPPLYREFIRTFEIGQKAIIEQMYLDKESDSLLYASAYEYFPNTDFTFENFLSLENCYNYWSEELKDTDVPKSKKLYPIGDCGSYQTINVGFGESNRDQIFLVSQYNEKLFLANNAFEFIRGIRVWTVDEDEDLKGSVPFDKLYKNWDEDFWRVRKE